ncbi:MAG: voltage-gated chloride channel family protein [Cryomorphaceae bacterium]|nr:voltage-gated chloride channel family protein [Cryomorphaceae bacterium]
MKLLARWLFVSVLVGIGGGAASAIFLHALHWATDYREDNVWIILFLPLAGLLIGWGYYKYGKSVVRGNNQIIEEYQEPKKVIPFRMAPMVLLGTVITHLFGGSAGREGTAIQMGAAIADRFTRWMKMSNIDRKLLLMMGTSAGFASVFGTPWAAIIFAFEVLRLDSFKWKRLVPIVISAFVGDWTCMALQVHHTMYDMYIVSAPVLTAQNIFWAALAGVIFGFGAFTFSQSNHLFGSLFGNYIRYSPLRPVIGGVVLAVVVFSIGTTKYIGLGIPVIEEAFQSKLPIYDFLVKTLFTAFTLGAGFKGGEVTPLFFVGATLGNALAYVVPLPLALMVGMGFVAVFAGATNTPIACTVMGLELFGFTGGIYILIACILAYIFSGPKGIYITQPKQYFKVPYDHIFKKMYKRSSQ